jgi:hypothetical protein
MDDELRRDRDGNIIVFPVTGWIAGKVAGISVLLAIQYENPGQFETSDKQVQLVLMPQQALELAEVLTRVGKSLLEPPQAEEPRH